MDKKYSTTPFSGPTTTPTLLETEVIPISESASAASLAGISVARSAETVSVAGDDTSRSISASDLPTLTIGEIDTTSSTTASTVTTTSGLEDTAGVSVLAAAQDANCSRTSTTTQSPIETTFMTVSTSTIEEDQIYSTDLTSLSYSQINSTTTSIPRFTLISESTETASTTSTSGPAPQLGTNGEFTDSVTIPSLTGVSISSTDAAKTDVTVTVTVSTTTSSAPAQLAQQEAGSSSLNNTTDTRVLATATTTSSILVPLATLDGNNSFTDSVIIPTDRPVTTTIASAIDVTRISSSPDSTTSKETAPTLSYVTVVVTATPSVSEAGAPVPPAPAAPDSAVLGSASNSETGAASMESLVIVPVTSSPTAPKAVQSTEAVATESPGPYEKEPTLDAFGTVDTLSPAPTEAASSPDAAIREAVETRVGADGRETVTIREIVRQREVQIETQTVTVTIKER